MILTAVLLFVIFLFFSAFFSASETALIASNPYTLDSLEQRGSRRARLLKRMLGNVDHLLAALLIGNNLVNVAAASVATLIFLSLVPDPKQAALLATLVTTLLILIFGEINPKTFAAYHPVRVSLLVARPLRFFFILFYPFARVFSLMSRLLVRTPPGGTAKSMALNEEEIRLVLTKGIKGMSSLRKKMIDGVLDIGARPVKEIMVPRPEVKAIEIGSSFKDIMDIVFSTEYSRIPVYRSRLDNIEGLIHTKDIIPYLIDNKEFSIEKILRQPIFVPESASIEKVLIQMQEGAVHLAFVVDEFGTLEGIVTLEDIIEEIVGEIQDEYDEKAEEWFHAVSKNAYVVRGNASLKELCRRLPLCLPQTGDFTTLAGFLLYQFGRIPHEKDVLTFKGNQFIVEKMTKRHISLVRIILTPGPREKAHEDHRHK
ncbi:MAG: HlyC/CorC family transporter [Candidatus Aminicenantes bacterium]|nr:HlyC/CorC family transporter [Candidatus Aminicenantes bacterium]